jgi:hypothetical protein
MTTTEFRAIIDRLGWKLLHLANVVGRNYAVIRKQAGGTRPIDPALADWLREADRLRAEPQAFRRWINTPPARVPRSDAPDQLPAAR